MAPSPNGAANTPQPRMDRSTPSHQPVNTPWVDRKLKKVSSANEIKPSPAKSSHWSSVSEMVGRVRLGLRVVLRLRDEVGRRLLLLLLRRWLVFLLDERLDVIVSLAVYAWGAPRMARTGRARSSNLYKTDVRPL